MAEELKKVEEDLKKAEIIHDVVDDFRPDVKLHITYDGVEIHGQELTPKATEHAPKFKVEGPLAANALFTLAFVDPDAPSRKDPKYRSWRHWLVVNIPGDQVELGHVLTPYIGPGPPPGTGLHRYTFWFYKQKAVIEDHLDNGDGRRSFDLRAWAKKHDLAGPAGAAYFEAKNDSN